jgi:Pvc16 N-terminal domain
MSNYSVFRDVSVVMRQLLWDAIKDDPMVNVFIKSEQDIGFADPAATLQAGGPSISLWLYAVRVDEFRRNDPAPRSSDTDWVYPPLPVDLSYLVTPLGPRDNPEAAHLILGHVMRTLYGNAMTVVSNSAGPVFEELKIVLAPLTLGELTAIWEALRQPYQLSVAYQIKMVRLDVDATVPSTRVLERTEAWAPLP